MESFVVPKDARKRILAECHDEIQASHLDQKKTYHRAYQSYFWVNMYKDVVKYVQSCYIYQQVKPLQTRLARFMEKCQVYHPFQGVAEDCTGPFSGSKIEYNHANVFEDMIYLRNG